ncbi:MAG: methyltransferase family protein [Terriglobia bacterium]
MRDAYLSWAARWRVPIGFVVAAAYLWLARATPVSLAAGAAIAAVGIGLRAVAAGYLRKGEALARGGPYAYVRHPLYLGSAFIVAGFVVASGRVWLGLALVGIFVALYVPVLLREEAELRARFPSDYAAYAAAVPLLFPRARPGLPGRSGERFDWGLYWRNREYNALAGYLVMLFLLYLRMWYRR